MGFVPNAFAIPAILSMLTAMSLAALVLGIAPGRALNRRLALVLFVEACVIGFGAGVLYLMSAPEDSAASQAIFVTAVIAQPYAYLWFLSRIDTPLSRPLRNPIVKAVLLALFLASEGYWLTHTSLFIPAVVHAWYAPWEAIIGPTFIVFLGIAGIVSLFGLAVAVVAFRRAKPGTPARSQARSYIMAFGLRDFAWFQLTFLWPLFLPVPPSGTYLDAAYIWGFSLVGVIFSVLLVYGILKSQMFDLDLKIKITIDRAFLAGVFLAVFFIVSQLIQTVATEKLGYIAGAIGAGLLLFAINPLQRVAERVSDRAMPKVRPTDEYLAFRKMQVYRAALEGAYEDGRVTDAERAMLRRLQKELQIHPDDAARIESDLAGAPA